jgi:hypothetical protein
VVGLVVVAVARLLALAHRLVGLLGLGLVVELVARLVDLAVVGLVPLVGLVVALVGVLRLTLP